MPRDQPEDYGFRKTRSGTRWQEWEGHGYRIGMELLDEDTGEWAAYYSRDGSNRSGAEYEEAWSEGSAMMHVVEFARELSKGDVDIFGGLK